MKDNNEKDMKQDKCITIEGVCSSINDELYFKCRMLLAVFASMGDGVYYTDPSRRILDWNRAAEELTGYKAEEVRGKNCSELLNHTDKNGIPLCETRCPLLNSVETSRKVTYEEIWMRKKDGQRCLIEVSCSPVTDENGTLIGIVEVFRDRTKQWNLDRMKEGFVAAITHDLKSPLTSIMGFAELLANPKLGEISPDKLEYVKMIRHSGNTLLSLISNIVDASRIEAGQMHYNFENFSLDDFFAELREIFQPQALKNHISLDLSCEENTWVYADRAKLLQVFHNLLSNALRYTPKEGKIWINAKRDKEHIDVEVHDTGKGIRKEEHERIFQRFVQAKGERQGTGLGLFIVKSILEGHSSKIRLESEEWKGAHFFFSIKKGTKPIEKKQHLRGSILLVAEESDQIRLVKLILEKAGHTVESAMSGLEGLQKAPSLKPDLILVQHPLPDIMVEDFAYSIHTAPATRTTPVALLSTIRLPEWEGSFSAIILLPVNMSLLKDSVQQLLQNRSGRAEAGHSSETLPS